MDLEHSCTEQITTNSSLIRGSNPPFNWSPSTLISLEYSTLDESRVLTNDDKNSFNTLEEATSSMDELKIADEEKDGRKWNFQGSKPGTTSDSKKKRFTWTDDAKEALLFLYDELQEKGAFSREEFLNLFVDKYPLYKGKSASLCNSKKSFFKTKSEQSEIVFRSLDVSKSEQFNNFLRVVLKTNIKNKVSVAFREFTKEFPKIEITQYQLKIYMCKVKASLENNIELESECCGSSKDEEMSIYQGLDEDKLADFDNFVKVLMISEVKNKIGMALEEFSSIFPETNITKNQMHHYWEKINQKRNIQESDFDSERITVAIQKYLNIGLKLCKTPIYKECCHNCGFLFFRDYRETRNLRNLLPAPLHGEPQVHKYFPDAVLPTYLSKTKKFITCSFCIKNPNLHQEYQKSLPNSEVIGVPRELENLNSYERSQIALCGVFHTVTQITNSHRRTYKHCQGHVNIGSNQSNKYYGNFITYYNVDRPEEMSDSNIKIRNALIWLKQNNHLYQNFYSNYETLYGYMTRFLKVHVNETTIDITHGDFEKIVDKDRQGALIPAENIHVNERLNPYQDQIAIQHPIAKKAFEENKQMVRVNYQDPYLEAKAWVVDHPTGLGSWIMGGSLKHREYWKWNAFSIDSRYRRNLERHFFTLDRFLKKTLIYYNRNARIVDSKNLEKTLTAQEVKLNEGRYGKNVPSNLPGSRNYWLSKSMELMAMVRELGKPTYFVTLTQNDSWPEIQIQTGKVSIEEYLEQEECEPPRSGEGVSNHPFEVTLAFHERFAKFKKHFINVENGPLGSVVDYWYRLEYQQRGATHVHMLLWIDPITINDKCISAEMPRSANIENETSLQLQTLRNYIKAFQVHKCIPGRCKTDKKGNALKNCKYGFPFKIQKETMIPKKGVRYLYKRTEDEDLNIVPYNLELLLTMQAHVNIQKVTTGSLEQYLTKYITKPESSLEARRETNNDADRFLRYRVVGILECLNILMEFPASKSSREIVYLPTDFNSDFKMLKRPQHMPNDPLSEDIYYGNNLDKYLDRPIGLKEFTYPEFWKQYDVNPVPKSSAVYQDFSQLSQFNDSMNSFDPEISKKGREYFDIGNKRYMKRRIMAVPRWRFLLPYGKDSEKYYEQMLLLRLPIHRSDLNNGSIFSNKNQTQTFMEECAIRNIIDTTKDVTDILQRAVHHGYSEEKLIELIQHLINQNWVNEEDVAELIQPYLDNMNEFNDAQIEEMDNEENDIDKYFQKQTIPLEELKKSMTDSQLKAITWLEEKLKIGEPIYVIISGDGGVGKSYFLQAVCALFREEKIVSAIVAPSANAAYLVNGSTVHNFLKMDINMKSYLQHGTTAARIVNSTEAMLVDEFGMTSYKLFGALDRTLREYSMDDEDISPNASASNQPFGRRHVILIGDPAQLESVEPDGIFSHPLLQKFKVIILKESVRQKDPVFSAMLRRIRLGEISENDEKLLRERLTNFKDIEFSEDSTVLVPHNVRRDFWNNKFLEKIPGETFVIDALDSYPDSNNLVPQQITNKIEKYAKSKLIKKLRIKKDCIVVLNRTLGNPLEGWPNGTRARVIGIGENKDYIMIESLDGLKRRYPLRKVRQEINFPAGWSSEKYYRTQFPIVLGYSQNVHAVQGKGLPNKVYIELDKKFWASGQAYVALSRVTELENLHLLTFDKESVKLKPEYKKILEWMEEVDEIGEIKKPRTFNDFPLIPKSVIKSTSFPPISNFEKNVNNESKIAVEKETFIEKKTYKPLTTMEKLNRPIFLSEKTKKEIQDYSLPPIISSVAQNVPEQNPKIIVEKIKLKTPPLNILNQQNSDVKTYTRFGLDIYGNEFSVLTDTKPSGTATTINELDFNQEILSSGSSSGHTPHELTSSRLTETKQSQNSGDLNRNFEYIPGEMLPNPLSPKRNVKSKPRLSVDLNENSPYTPGEMLPNPLSPKRNPNKPLHSRTIESMKTFKSKKSEPKILSSKETKHSVQQKNKITRNQTRMQNLHQELRENLSTNSSNILEIGNRFAECLHESIILQINQNAISSIENFDQIVLNTYEPFEAEIQSLINIVQNQSPVVYSNQRTDYISSRSLPIPITQNYQSVSTCGDGNCFYRAVSHNLFGNQNHDQLLRVLLTYDVARYRDYWGNFLFRTHADYGYNLFLFRCFNQSTWADQNHIFASSRLLQRPIQIYGNFNQESLMAENISELQTIMENSMAGHHTYLFSEEFYNQPPITMHHNNHNPDLPANHFTALLRRRNDVPIFQTGSNMFIRYRDFHIPNTEFEIEYERIPMGGWREASIFSNYQGQFLAYFGGAIALSGIFIFANLDLGHFAFLTRNLSWGSLQSLTHGDIINPERFAQASYNFVMRGISRIRGNIIEVLGNDIRVLETAMTSVESSQRISFSSIFLEMGLGNQVVSNENVNLTEWFNSSLLNITFANQRGIINSSLGLISNIAYLLGTYLVYMRKKQESNFYW